MIWNHDQDEPLMTRRKFFFLTGMAGAWAVAQQTGLIALVEPVLEPRPPFRQYYGKLDDIGDILAEIYAPLIRKQLRENGKWLRMLGGHDAFETVAREYHVPLATVPNTD